MNVLLRGSLAQRLRLGAGLILLAFVLAHFLNHAVGLLGVDAMIAVQRWRTGVTRTWAVTALLLGAVMVHVALGLARLAQRRTYRMPIWEALQIATGLAIPFLLVPHVIGTGVARRVGGLDDTYLVELALLWPDGALERMALLGLVWLHACMGLNYWLRLDARFRRLAPVLLAFAVAVPILALAGFIAAGRESAALLAQAGAFERLQAASHWPPTETWDLLARLQSHALTLMTVAVALAVATPLLRTLSARAAARVQVSYVKGPSVRTPIGPTLLEISRMRGIPHTSVCGGRARCTTCRVRVEVGLDDLTPAGWAEAIALGSIGAPKGVRLACQMRPMSDLTVLRLVWSASMRAGLDDAAAAGQERTLTVMFLDLRGFTRLSERKLPYDVVHVLNRFFEAVGGAIAREGGVIHTYLGDGLMAVFGRDGGPGHGAVQALAASRGIDLALDGVNSELRSEVGGKLRIGIGLHTGPLVVGRIGYADTAAVTVIGSTVNVASRLEALTKDHHCQLVLSRAVAEAAGLDTSGRTAQTAEIRGHTGGPVEVYCIERARDLAGR